MLYKLFRCFDIFDMNELELLFYPNICDYFVTQFNYFLYLCTAIRNMRQKRPGKQYCITRNSYDDGKTKESNQGERASANQTEETERRQHQPLS